MVNFTEISTAAMPSAVTRYTPWYSPGRASLGTDRSIQKPCVSAAGKSKGTAVNRACSNFPPGMGCSNGISGSGYQSVWNRSFRYVPTSR